MTRLVRPERTAGGADRGRGAHTVATLLAGDQLGLASGVYFSPRPAHEGLETTAAGRGPGMRALAGHHREERFWPLSRPFDFCSMLVR